MRHFSLKTIDKSHAIQLEMSVYPRAARNEKAAMVWRNHDGFEMGTKARRGG
jgi:hypothetical protein